MRNALPYERLGCSWNASSMRTSVNGNAVSGNVRGEDRDRGLVYQMTFSLTSKHLSEGLFRRSLSVVPLVKNLSK